MTDTKPATPPAGYRWARSSENGHPDAVLVKLTVDSYGAPFTGDEADEAVPISTGATEAIAAWNAAYTAYDVDRMADAGDDLAEILTAITAALEIPTTNGA